MTGLRNWGMLAALCTIASLAACGGDGETKTLVYSAPGASDAQLDLTVDVMRERVEALELDDVDIERLESASIEITLPEHEGRVTQIVSSAQLAFYDWEANVVGDVADAADRPIARLSDAQELAAQNPGAIVVEAESAPDDPETKTDEAESSPQGYFVIRDRPALTGEDITDPEQIFEPVANQPVIAFGFTEQGAESFEELTRGVAERGRKQTEGSTIVTPTYSHFAIVVGDEVVSRPMVDPNQNPNGIDADNGAMLEGSFTIQEAQELARFLAIGPLPVRLKRIE